MDADELRDLFLFEDLADDQLEELAAAAEEVTFAPGDVLFREGEPAEAWWVLLAGQVDLLRRGEHQESVVGAMDRPGVWAGGFHAWTDTAGYMGTARAATAGRMLRVPSSALGRLTREWFPLGVHLIEGFFQTVRGMESMARQRAGLIALGTLAAGLAHELNNPVAAAERATVALQEASDALLASLVALAEGSLSAEQFVAIDRLRCELDPAEASTNSLAVADREAALLDWFNDQGIEQGWQVAPDLAMAGVDVAWCERLAAALGDRNVGPALQWVANTVSTAALLGEIAESTGRVSALVDAVKSYSQLDRASLQRIDVTDGIDSTLTVLRHRLHDGLTLVRDDDPDLPRIEAHPSELNQVWTNLVDNAVDAIDGRGTLRVSTHLDDDHVVVEVGDSGPGMPAEVMERAFEPFFTTKDVGRGTGLGLDIARRIVVERHRGQITVTREGEETVVRVRLPRDHS